MGDDARRESNLRRADRAPGAGRGVARPGAEQPDLPADLQRPRRLAGVHGDGEAVRAAHRGPLRPARARHAADPQRARLSRRAETADPVHRGPLAAHVHEADRAGGEGRRPRRLGRAGDLQADRRLRPARRPGRVLQRLQRHGRRLPGAGEAGQQAARRSRHLLPGRLRPAGRADRRGRLLPPQTGRVEASLRRRDREQGPLPGRAATRRGRRPAGGTGGAARRRGPGAPGRRQLLRLPGAGGARRPQHRAPRPRAAAPKA